MTGLRHFFVKISDNRKIIEIITFFRSTDEFDLSVSEESTSWVSILSDRLVNPQNPRLGCSVPLKKFQIQYVYCRYVKFSVLSYFGKGGGLGYMEIEYFQ